HVLQYHFSEYFPKVKMLIEEGNKRFAFTLSHCYKSGEAEAPANAEMFDGLIEEYGKRIPGVN
ncbi:MAG TPA: hypothetical protein VKB86_16425, partial [Pyrinomonadaceae bacterium]|nr:hypothetical protein [Pyrinomonadaceae bacterium]